VEQRQVDGIDTYGFPRELLGHPQLVWMGEDYVQFIAAELLVGFRKNDPATEMLAMHCEQQPELSIRADERTGTAIGADATFSMQVLLQSSNGQCWRLRGDARFTADGLNQRDAAQVAVAFVIRSSEAVSS
jgi:hypothetical protein